MGESQADVAESSFWQSIQILCPSRSMRRPTCVCYPQRAQGSALYFPTVGGAGKVARLRVKMASSGDRRISLILVLSSRWKACCSSGVAWGEVACFRRLLKEPSRSNDSQYLQ